MTGLESNVFPIRNLAGLTSAYRLLKCRGLRKDQPEYYQNRQALVRKLSYELKSPVTIVEKDDEPYLVVRTDSQLPQSPCRLVRTTVYLDPLREEHKLDFTVRDAEKDAICLRFLQFMLQARLANDGRLWQPGSGSPFFVKDTPVRLGQLLRFTGFSVRVITTIDSGLGLSVDVAHKTVSAEPLASRMTRAGFRHWKGPHCIYHFGHKWYEISPVALSDINVSEERFTEGGQEWRLIDFVAAKSEKPIPPELLQLPHDGSVLYYFTNQRLQRSAPTGLCYQVYDNNSPEVRRNHGDTLLTPSERREKIHSFVHEYLERIRFGDCVVEVSPEPVRPPQKMFLLPDLEFGQSRVLSVRGTPHAQQVGLDRVGATRLNLLSDPDAGFFHQEPLDRQYLFLPQSVHESFGQQFVTDLRGTVNEFFPQGEGYQPIIIPYNDRGPRTVVQQGKAILSAAEGNCKKPGYALVMIHHTENRAPRQQDQLAALVIRELRKVQLQAAVNHSRMSQQSYEHARRQDGTSFYRIREDQENRFRGYLRAVALNKILLTNERWPFVLATATHADVTVGIDVKHHTAGFTIVGKRGSLIRTMFSVSNQKEQLLEDQVWMYVTQILRKEAAEPGVNIQSIVFHRDGRIYPSELRGIRKAIRGLIEDGTLSRDVAVSILEIAKTSPAPIRLFDVSPSNPRHSSVTNPQVGNYWIMTEADGHLCATGRPFTRKGTVRPLHVHFVEGTIPFELCLEDAYYLTALPWTRPEDCTRYPITIKLNDRRLSEEASEYDRDALEFSDTEVAEELA